MAAFRQHVAPVVDALRAQARALNALADLLEVDTGSDFPPESHASHSGAFTVEVAARYCGIGTTLLRERGPAPRYVGGRAIWLRDELDNWLRALSAESGHRRGRRQSPVRRAHGAAQ
ncbi:MAG: hypothetical protein M0Z95_19020 [Actinomycetota bacterium]|nr:hypothetical protein [Actinomycetota bacterium]